MPRSALAIAALLALSVGVSACRPSASPEHYGYLARLGADTVSIESVTRTADTVVSDEVDRFPRVRRRHTRLVLGPGGQISHLEMDIRTPSEPVAQQLRHVVADVTKDSVKITKRDSSGVVTRAFATRGALTMPHLPQMYSLTDLYFAAALARAQATKLALGDSITLRQYYIDREFDRFPLHSGNVRPLKDGRAELWHDWLSGVAEASFDSSKHMVAYSGARSTYKVDVKRLTDPPDVAAIGERFAALETQQGGVRQLSVRDTMRAAIGSVNFIVDYGRPLARGRVLLGNILPYDFVWRTGANAATQFTTSAPIILAGMSLGAGTYTLWTVPRADGRAELIVNSQTGQWGTEYDETHDIGMKGMRVDSLSTPVEQFTINIVSNGTMNGALVLEWGSFRWTAPIIAP